MYYILSVFLGLIPEVLYFTLFLIYTKNIKEKRILLFLLISLAYTLTVFIKQYILVYYLSFIVLVYLILKLLYKQKTQIIDIFVISISTIYLTLLSYICFLFLKSDMSNYWLLYTIDRMFLLFIFIFRKRFNVLYKKYCKLWNRNDKEKRPIKSITLRNISLIIINIAIVLMNILAISIINFLK